MIYLFLKISIPKIGNAAAAAKSLQSSPRLYNPRDGRPPGSSVHVILQASTLEQVAISFSERGNNTRQYQSATMPPSLTHACHLHSLIHFPSSGEQVLLPVVGRKCYYFKQEMDCLQFFKGDNSSRWHNSYNRKEESLYRFLLCKDFEEQGSHFWECAVFGLELGKRKWMTLSFLYLFLTLHSFGNFFLF